MQVALSERDEIISLSFDSTMHLSPGQRFEADFTTAVPIHHRSAMSPFRLCFHRFRFFVIPLP